MVTPCLVGKVMLEELIKVLALMEISRPEFTRVCLSLTTSNVVQLLLTAVVKL